MGSGVATALGVADRCGSRRVVAIVGDGDLLMGAGTLWTFAGLAPSNLAVLVLRDGRYSITGGQSLVETDSLGAVCASFHTLAAAEAATPEAVEDALRNLALPGIVLAEISESEWPGPSPFVDPASVRTRFAERAAEPAG